VRFNRLDESAMTHWWKQEQSRERIESPDEESKSRKKKEVFDPSKVPAPAARWSLAFAEGSPGTALLAIEYGFHTWQQTLDPMLREIDRGIFPVGMGDALGATVDEFAQAWVKRHGEKETSKDAANKDGARHVLSLLGAHARQRLAAVVQDDDDDEAAERWAQAIDLLRECERQIESNVNQKLAMENLVAQWATALSGHLVA
jgi:hypothetical protein